MSDDDISKGRPDEFHAFSKFKEEIENQANIKYEAVINTGKEEAEKIREASRKEAEKYKSDLLNKAKSEANQIKVREVSRKKLTVKMDYLKVRDQIFEEIVVEAKSKLQTYTQSKEYATFLQNILSESAASMFGGDLLVQLRSEDKKLLSQEVLDKIAAEISKTTGNETKISIDKSDLKALGGIRVVRSDDRLYVDNTFEARLKRMDEEIRVSLVETLEN